MNCVGCFVVSKSLTLFLYSTAEKLNIRQRSFSPYCDAKFEILRRLPNCIVSRLIILLATVHRWRATFDCISKYIYIMLPFSYVLANAGSNIRE